MNRIWLTGAKRIVAVACVLVTTTPAEATIVASIGNVALLHTYATFGGGDVVVRLSSQPATCASGFWLSPTQPGFKNNLAFLLSVKAAGDAVLIGADDAAMWSGSAGSYCRVDYIATPP